MKPVALPVGMTLDDVKSCLERFLTLFSHGNLNMEITNTDNITDGKDKTQSEKMELDVNPRFKAEPTDHLQSSSSQSVLTGEPCTSSQSESNKEKCIKIESEQTEEPCTSGQSESNEDQSTNTESGQTGVQCIKIESEQTEEPCTSGQSESNAGQCTNTESEQTVQSIPNEDQGIKIKSEETGGYVTSVHESGETENECISLQSEPAEDQQKTSKTSGSAVMQCETVVSPVSGSGSLALLSMQYRGNSSDDNGSDSDSDSSSSTSSSSTSSSSSSSEPLALTRNRGEDDDGVNMGNGKTPTPLKTQDELLIEDLPEVENLTISLPDDAELEAIGTISSIVEQLVIVESYKNTRALNEDSVLFSSNKNSIGKVFEIFGPVCQPYYVLRFNSKEDIDKKDLKIHDPIYFAPKIKDFTDYIFTERLKATRGSDASWKNDQEPPPEALEFSDDEQERLAKQKKKEQKRRQQNDSDTDDESDKAPPPQKPARRKPRQNRNAQRGQHHNRGGGFHSNYHAHPHFPPPDYMFPHPDPHLFPFQGPMYPPYPRPPPPFHMGMPPWLPGANQGFMFQPPPPPPPPPPPSNP